MFLRDKTIRLGSTHEMCEDYAISGETDKIGYVIVSDGCSSSPNTDLGARILTHVASKHIDMIASYIPNMSDHSNYYAVGKSIALMADSIIKQIGIQENLDATLIVAMEWPTNFTVIIYGDGFIFRKIKYSDTIIIHKIEYNQNYPFYLSYMNNESREQNHINIVGNKPVTRTRVEISKDHNFSDNEKLPYPSVMTIDKDEIDVLGISTDGIDTFTSMIDGKRLDYENVVEKLVNLKSRSGKFLQRRTNKVLREFSKENINHFDDLGIAMFAFVED